MRPTRALSSAGWWTACVLLWWAGRAAALLARRAFVTTGVLPLELLQGLVLDALWVSACFAIARRFASCAVPWCRRVALLPALVLALSAAARVVDAVHCQVGMSHVTAGFWWHVSWDAWPVLLESGAPVAVGLAFGAAWFAWRAVRLDTRQAQRAGALADIAGLSAGEDASRPLRTPQRGRRGQTRGSAVLGALWLACVVGGLVWPPHPHHQGLLPELNLVHAWLAFHGVRPPPTARPPDTERWRRWQGAGLVPSDSLRDAAAPLWRPAGPAAPAARRPPNVLIVFMESFNRALTSLPAASSPASGPTPPVTDFTPNLARLAARMTDVRGYHTQARPTHFGLVASLCGVLPGTWPLDVNLRGKPLPRLSCLPSWLKAGGHHTIFMQGAALRHTGLDRTMSAVGFDELSGREALGPGLPNAPRNAWGLYDRQTLSAAVARLQTLRAAGTPFLLSLVTVDSHYPGTAHPDCRPPPALAQDPIRRAIFCADAELAVLIGALDQLDLWRDTLIVFTADHAMQDLSDVRALVGLQAAGAFAELPLLIHDPEGRLGRHHGVVCGQTDLAPTLAALLGLHPGASVQGHDLFGDRKAFPWLIGLMGRRAVGVRCGAHAATFAPAELARSCARGGALLPGSPPGRCGSLTACDVASHLFWIDGLWFEDRLAPPS